MRFGRAVGFLCCWNHRLSWLPRTTPTSHRPQSSPSCCPEDPPRQPRLELEPCRRPGWLSRWLGMRHCRNLYKPKASEQPSAHHLLEWPPPAGLPRKGHWDPALAAAPIAPRSGERLFDSPCLPSTWRAHMDDKRKVAVSRTHAAEAMPPVCLWCKASHQRQWMPSSLCKLLWQYFSPSQHCPNHRDESKSPPSIATRLDDQDDSHHAAKPYPSNSVVPLVVSILASPFLPPVAESFYLCFCLCLCPFPLPLLRE
mmetsp:Transcript_53351/g.124944  ORF Transcript_53351/g.124944 Transcript_53351/m.124944 type:complete len:255 (-) Transcript_53351:812-1576(-)